jgi:hypothetical protein
MRMILTSPLHEYGGAALKAYPSSLRCVAAALAPGATIQSRQPAARKALLQVRRSRMHTVRACPGVNVYGSRPDWNSRLRSEREENDAMREIEIHDYARQLLEAHGAKAIAEAAQNAIELEAKGEVELARTWRHIEDAMKIMRGPHQS